MLYIIKEISIHFFVLKILTHDYVYLTSHYAIKYKLIASIIILWMLFIVKLSNLIRAQAIIRDYTPYMWLSPNVIKFNKNCNENMITISIYTQYELASNSMIELSHIMNIAVSNNANYTQIKSI